MAERDAASAGTSAHGSCGYGHNQSWLHRSAPITIISRDTTNKLIAINKLRTLAGAASRQYLLHQILGIKPLGFSRDCGFCKQGSLHVKETARYGLFPHSKIF